MSWLKDLIELGVRPVRRRLDERKIHAWLREHTEDRPARTHKSTVEISVGVNLPEDRVGEACITSKRIKTHASHPERWSVWREREQSRYEDPDAEMIVV